MRSHSYQLTGRVWIECTVLPLAPVVLFALLMHGSATLGLLPAPRPATDVDKTIIVHQADAGRDPAPVQWLLLGDSSCLMDVDALQLTEALAAPALNLGTSSYLDLEAYGVLAGAYASAHPGPMPTVVLLMHPEALRRSGGELHQTQVLSDYLNQLDALDSSTWTDRVKGWTGMALFKGRILSRLLPHAMPGAFGRAYGFTHDLEARMSAHRGSLLEPATTAPSGNPEYTLNRAMEKFSAQFRTSLPLETKLIVGISPLPESYAPPDFARRRDQLLEQWAQWIGATARLEGLPATLPDALFATKTHLNQAGVRAWTGLLAQRLAQVTQQPR